MAKETSGTTRPRPLRPIFDTVERPDPVGSPTAALKTYRYLRLGMLVLVAALGYAILDEYRQAHCFLGSISGYWYTPVRPVFIGVMVAIGVSLIVIKGKTAFEDAALSVAGIFAPVVAFIPTSDDLHGVCRPQMLAIGHYEPDPHTGFAPASISNNLHALVFAGLVAIVLLGLAYGIEYLRHRSDPAFASDFTLGTKINLVFGLVLVVGAFALLHWDYSWLLKAHGLAAAAMFAALGTAAIGNAVVGLRASGATPGARWSAGAYGFVGLAMFGVGVAYLITKYGGAGHGVLIVEFSEITLFVVFWVIQTIERWYRTA